MPSGEAAKAQAAGVGPRRKVKMIKSMTGVASVTREDDRAPLSGAIRALNHRHLDLPLPAPAGCGRHQGGPARPAGEARQTGGEALADLDTMRSREGDHLRADLDERRTLVADLVERVAVAADQGRDAMEERLRERVRELRADLQADETAVAQEIVRMAARSDISEELARFRAHVSHWITLADSAEPSGRKLDFLLQEMNREVNTMGSKADGLRVSELIIAAKAELEKMREQVQNVE